MNAFSVLALTLLLAGCLQQPAEPPALPPSIAAAQDDVLDVNRQFGLSVTGAKAAGQRIPLATYGNCVAVTGQGRVVSGSATASWNESDVPQEFELVALQADETAFERGRGRREVTIPLAGLVLDGRGAVNAFLFVQVPEGAIGISSSKPAKLTLDNVVFEREPGTRLAFEEGWSCSTES